MILWDFYTTFVKMHELRASVNTWIMMFFGSAQWSCEHETHKCRFITSIRKYPPYWKFRLVDFPLGIYATSNFMWIISFMDFHEIHEIHKSTMYFVTIPLPFLVNKITISEILFFWNISTIFSLKMNKSMSSFYHYLYMEICPKMFWSCILYNLKGYSVFYSVIVKRLPVWKSQKCLYFSNLTYTHCKESGITIIRFIHEVQGSIKLMAYGVVKHWNKSSVPFAWTSFTKNSLRIWS